MRRLLSWLGIAAGMLISLMALAPTAAQAAPGGCSAVTYDTYVEGLCDSGDGLYRVVAVCEYVRLNPIDGTPYFYTRNEYGAWVGIGVVSTAYCQPGGGTLNGYVQTQ
jgi:hypothetical protein